VSSIPAPSSPRRALSPETAASSLGGELGLGAVDEEELYRALDWLAVRQPAIETALARRHPKGGTRGALRRDFERLGGAVLPARSLWRQPRWQARQAADLLQKQRARP
jgi:hypothetical protein